MERICAQLVSFIISTRLAIILDPDEYGLIAIVLVFITIADVFVSSGFSAALVQKKDADDLDYSTMFYCSLRVSIIMYGIIYLCAPRIAHFYDNESLIMLIRVFSLRLPLSVLNSIQHAYISSNMLFRKFFWSTLFGTVISGSIGLWMAHRGFGVWSLVAQYLMNTVVDTLVLLFTISWRPKLMFSLERADKLMSFGSKVLLAALSGTVFDQLRSFIIGKKYTAADLAYYNKGQQFSSLLTTNISTSIMAVLFPSISKVSDDISKVKNMTKKSIEVLAFVMFPLLFGLAACAEPIVIVLITEKWIKCVPFIQILSMYSLINILGGLPLEAFKALGRGDVTLKLEFIKKPVYLLLLLAGMWFGPLAMAVTLALYSLYGAGINMFYLSKLTNYKVSEQLGDVFPVFVVSLVMALAVYFVPIPINSIIVKLAVKVLMGAAIYVVGTLIIKPEGFVYIWNIIEEKFFKKQAGNTYEY